jgi:voltage-gated sodium channel
MVEQLQKLAAATWFSNFITAVIVAAAVLVGLETYPSIATEYHGAIHYIDKIILWIFVFEVVVKMGAEFPKLHNYFKDPWNDFDFFIVAACFVPGLEKYALVLRLLRLLRVLKLVTALPKLQILVGALLKSVPSMFYVSVLLGLLFYVYACAGVFMFSANDPWHFGDLQTAMLTLFRAVTLEDWTDLMYIQMFGCEMYPFPDMGASGPQCTAPEGNWWLGMGYFVSFVLLGTMIILNLFIGVIMNGMDEAQKEAEDLNEEQRRKDRGFEAVTLEHEMFTLTQQIGDLAGQVKKVEAKLKARIDEMDAPAGE